MRKKKIKHVTMGAGNRCKHCHTPMVRRRHPEGMVLEPGQFREWDYCPRCTHVQHYEEFRIRREGEPEPAPKLPKSAKIARQIAQHTGNVHLGPGGPCDHCHGPTERFAHPDGWKPPEGQRRYAKYWDRCIPCNQITYRPEAVVVLAEKTASDPHMREYEALLEHFESI